MHRRRRSPDANETSAGQSPDLVRGPIGNSFGLPEAMFGIAGGFVLAYLAVSAYAALARHAGHSSQYGENVVGLVALWVGFIGAAIVATKLAAREQSQPTPGRAQRTGRPGTGSLVADYGLKLRPWPDIPLGIVVGVASQYLLVPVVEAPLVPFVHHLYSRLGHPAQSLTGNAFGAGLIVLSVLVCLGSPVVEELFFRGLLLRSLLGSFEGLGSWLAPLSSIVVTAVVFALVHFEALQFLGLAGFGVVLGVLAWKTQRLGPSIVAHMAFNTVTIIAIVAAR
ncbi:MAG: CPBP family intramembrane glutamic endopeptidase [Acidimicrobiales bacterium]